MTGTARERAPLPRRRLGRSLQRLREQAGLTQRQAGYNGDPAAHRAQLRRIVERAGLANVTVRVLPAAKGVHGGLIGGLILLSFPDKEDDDVVYLEHVLGANHTDNTAEVAAG